MVDGERPAVFLDRDGVLNESVVRNGRPYPPASLADARLLHDAVESVQRLKAAGFVTVVVTNQPDVAKGLQSREVVDDINAMIVRETGVDAVKVCWCLEVEDCPCYKPKPGMLLDASREMNLDISRSYMVGDRWRDVGAGINAGCKTILIERGYDESGAYSPDITVSCLSAAVDYIMDATLSSRRN